MLVRNIVYQSESCYKDIEIVGDALPANFNELYFEKLFEKPKVTYEEEQEVWAAFFITDRSLGRILTMLDGNMIFDLPPLMIDIGSISPIPD